MGQLTTVGILAATKSTYVVQLSSFKNKANAQRFIKTIKKKGYTPFLDKGRKGKGWYHVRIGPYPSRQEADLVAGELERVEGVSAIVIVSMRVDAAQQQPEPPPAVENDRVLVEETSPTQVLPAPVPDDAGETVDVVMSRFLVWLQAWQDKDLDQYMAFYSQDFEGSSGSLKKWQRSRRKAFQKKGRIKIEVSDVQILEKDGSLEMSFIQNYASDIISDVGRKVLLWQKEGGQWKIAQETWSPV